MIPYMPAAPTALGNARATASNASLLPKMCSPLPIEMAPLTQVVRGRLLPQKHRQY